MVIKLITIWRHKNQECFLLVYELKPNFYRRQKCIRSRIKLKKSAFLKLVPEIYYSFFMEVVQSILPIVKHHINFHFSSTVYPAHYPSQYITITWLRRLSRHVSTFISIRDGVRKQCAITFDQASSITAHLHPLIIPTRRVKPIGTGISTSIRSIFLPTVIRVYL